MEHDDRVLEMLAAEHERVLDAVKQFRAAGVTAPLGSAQARVYSGKGFQWPHSTVWFDNGPTVYVDLLVEEVDIYTIDRVDGVDRGLTFKAPTIASAVALAAENADMRRWLGLPEPA